MALELELSHLIWVLRAELSPLNAQCLLLTTDSSLQPPQNYFFLMARFLNTRTEACQAIVAHIFNPSTRKAEAMDFCDFEAILVYRASSRAAKATLRNPFSRGMGDPEPRPNQRQKPWVLGEQLRWAWKETSSSGHREFWIRFFHGYCLLG